MRTITHRTTEMTNGRTGSHLENLSVSIDHVNGDLNVLLNALPASLKVSSLQHQVQVITDVT